MAANVEVIKEELENIEHSCVSLRFKITLTQIKELIKEVETLL